MTELDPKFIEGEFNKAFNKITPLVKNEVDKSFNTRIKPVDRKIEKNTDKAVRIGCRIDNANEKIAELKKQSAKNKAKVKIHWYIIIGIAGFFTLVIAWILLFYID